MAKTSQVNRNAKRQGMAKRDKGKRAALKAIVMDRTLPARERDAAPPALETARGHVLPLAYIRARYRRTGGKRAGHPQERAGAGDRGHEDGDPDWPGGGWRAEDDSGEARRGGEFGATAVRADLSAAPGRAA